MKTFAIALLAASVNASGYGAKADRALELNSARHHDVTEQRLYTQDATANKTISNSGVRQNRHVDTIEGETITYDSVPETTTRSRIVDKLVNRPVEVQSTSYTLERVPTKQLVTRYDLVDEEYDTINSQFVVGQKDVNVVESRVEYDDVTTTRDNYLTINKFCPVRKTRQVEEHYIERVEKQQEVNIDYYEEVWKTRDVTSYETINETSYVNKKVEVCDSSSSDDGYSSPSGYGGWSSSSDDCRIIWKSVPVTSSRQVPVTKQERYLAKEPRTRTEIQTYFDSEPRTRTVEESYEENERCTETINHPTTSTNSVPRTVLINKTKQVPVSSIQNTKSTRTRKVAVPRKEYVDNYTVRPVAHVTTELKDNYVNVQSTVEDSTTRDRLVARTVPTSRKAARYEDYVNTTSYETPFQAVADKYQTVTRQKTSRHAHAKPVLGAVDGAQSSRSAGLKLSGRHSGRAYGRGYGAKHAY